MGTLYVAIVAIAVEVGEEMPCTNPNLGTEFKSKLPEPYAELKLINFEAIERTC